AMTANAFTEDRIRAKEAGMDEHVAKPVDVELLVKVIHKLVG
ncbi:MAG TPA: hybrid sensor histidine kinase/response regulator, partial [Lachnospiraceae bacterium]|nr:hybrid sensor histidine kinase/response regulator [Lachnospiraceae bacterium]